MKKLTVLILSLALCAAMALPALADGNETEPIGDFKPIGLGGDPAPSPGPDPAPDPEPVTDPDPAADPADDFTDVPAGAYYHGAVCWAVEKGVTNGVSATEFAPASTVTRAQAVTFLWRAAGKPAPTSSVNPFEDVKKGENTDWYYDAVLWAVEKGITNGTSATTFSPDDPVTRGQMATFLWRTLGKPGDTGSLVWYADAVAWADSRGVTDGTAEAFTVDGACPRSDVVFYLYNALA